MFTTRPSVGVESTLMSADVGILRPRILLFPKYLSGMRSRLHVGYEMVGHAINLRMGRKIPLSSVHFDISSLTF